MKLVLTGGFLGSGKTTAIVNAARLLMKANNKVAVITNDQGDQQVDGAFVRSLGIDTREVSQGCFCCHYQQLDEHVESLRQGSPDIIFAESVGSCTDLVATLAKPLQQFKPEIETVLSIFTDADLLGSVIEGRSSFSEESVRYIYKKQVEEADILILNKADLLTSTQLNAIKTVVDSEYPGKIILQQNSMNDNDIAKWLQCIDEFTMVRTRNALEINYDLYGDGESKLAWLDKAITIHTEYGDATFVASQIIRNIADEIQMQRLVIGHLKFLLDTDMGQEKISMTTTSTSAHVKLGHQVTNRVKLLVNARVETGPSILLKVVDESILKASNIFKCRIDPGNWSSFKPGYPRPTHRIP